MSLMFQGIFQCARPFKYIQIYSNTPFVCSTLPKKETPAFYPVLHPVFHENTGSVLTKSLKSRAPASGVTARPNVLSVSLFSSCPNVFHLVREMHAVTGCGDGVPNRDQTGEITFGRPAPPSAHKARRHIPAPTRGRGGKRSNDDLRDFLAGPTRKNKEPRSRVDRRPRFSAPAPK